MGIHAVSTTTLKRGSTALSQAFRNDRGATEGLANSSCMSARPAFSELLREHRHTAGYSQEELADRAGISLGAIGSLEQGLRRAPHRDTVKALADALDMSAVARKEFEEAAARARGRQRRDVSGIPLSLTSFIERNEVSELKGLVADHRLLTVAGSPGIGRRESRPRWPGASKIYTTEHGLSTCCPFAIKILFRRKLRFVSTSRSKVTTGCLESFITSASVTPC